MYSKYISKIVIIITISVFVIAQTGCKYFYSNPILSSSENMENEISQIINIMDYNGQFSGAVLISVKGDIIYIFRQ